MTYIGNPVSQLDGTWAQDWNCVAATVSELGDCSSLGFWKVPPSRIRTLTGDYLGGLTYTDAAEALKTATNGDVVVSYLYWVPSSTLDDLLNAPRISGIVIDCSVTRYTPFRTGTFTGLHSVVVGAKRIITLKRSDGTSYKQKQAFVMDPINNTWVWWPWSLLMQAANYAAGAGLIHVIYTRDLANVTRTTTSDGYIRSSAHITNNKISPFVNGKSFTVIQTIRGGVWTVQGREGKGWSRIGTNKYVVGGKLR